MPTHLLEPSQVYHYTCKKKTLAHGGSKKNLRTEPWDLRTFLYLNTSTGYMLEMPQEIEVWYVLPALRRKLAQMLLEMGLKQKEVAKILGITPAAISQYATNKRAAKLKFSNELEQEIKKSAQRIKDNPRIVHGELQKLCDEIRFSGLLCEIHKEHVKNLDECRICMEKRSGGNKPSSVQPKRGQ